MSTGYHIEAGYNSGCSREVVEEQLLAEVDSICDNPEQILCEVERVEKLKPSDEYADCYRKPWSDCTIKILNDGHKISVMQMASGGGDERGIKESMRRAFCRLVLERMHRNQMEVNVIVS